MDSLGAPPAIFSSLPRLSAARLPPPTPSLVARLAHVTAGVQQRAGGAVSGRGGRGPGRMRRALRFAPTWPRRRRPRWRQGQVAPRAVPRRLFLSVIWKEIISVPECPPFCPVAPVLPLPDGPAARSPRPFYSKMAVETPPFHVGAGRAESWGAAREAGSLGE